MSPWTERHRPSCFEEVKGQDEAIKKIKRFVEEFNLAKLTKKPAKKSLILYGPPGTGKTTLAHVAAKEANSEIFELNASDFRTKEKLNEILKPAMEQKTIMPDKLSKLILVDEVDGISGFVDRGGINELLNLIEKTPYPIIITANDVWDKKLSDLRKISEMIQMKEIDYKTINEVLSCILKKENLNINQNLIKSISVRAKGDLRAAINDIQSVSRLKDPELITLDERNKELDIFNAMRMIFKDKPTKETLGILDQVNMNLDEIMLWMEENIPAEYQGEALAKAIDRLSRTDVFKGRIHKQQYWRFLVYENILLSYGMSSAKSNKPQKAGFTAYKKPSRILKIWMHNQRTAKKKSISEKYAAYTHVGVKRAMNEFPILKQIIRSQPEIEKELKLTADEMAYVREN